MKKMLLVLFLMGISIFTQAQNPLQDYKIAYNLLENRDADDYEVYIMNPDGTGKANITKHPDVAWTYYAYRDKLYWISDRDTCHRCYYLYRSDADGKDIKKVGGPRLEDSWMASRKKGCELIVAGRIGKELRYQLFIVDTDSGKFRQITNDTAAQYADPTFSPDGKQIVYRYKKHKRDRIEKAELWMANADGSNPRQLTHYPPTDTTAEWHAYHAGPPHWNAKLNLITYQSKQNGKYGLYAVSPDGKRNFLLHDFGMEAGWHDWSPDGRYLAVELFADGNSPSDIYLWDYETKQLTRLTDGPGYESSPVWVRK
ncbi:MAG: PD40 domain-containing protein [Saprospiraceae bacterium]|nr:PD40 domain-containing protein [Saprospiraceae bacterium]